MVVLQLQALSVLQRTRKEQVPAKLTIQDEETAEVALIRFRYDKRMHFSPLPPLKSPTTLSSLSIPSFHFTLEIQNFCEDDKERKKHHVFLKIPYTGVAQKLSLHYDLLVQKWTSKPMLRLKFALLSPQGIIVRLTYRVPFSLCSVSRADIREAVMQNNAGVGQVSPVFVSLCGVQGHSVILQ